MAVSIGFDEPYWGRRPVELGVGTAPIPYPELSPARLADAIRQLTDDPAGPGRLRWAPGPGAYSSHIGMIDTTSRAARIVLAMRHWRSVDSLAATS